MKTDPTLLNAVKSMDPSALAEVFDEYAPALYKYALRMYPDPLMADHIVGDVFAKLLERVSCGNGPNSNLRSYLFEITYHLIVDQVRYLRRSVPLEAAEYRRWDGQHTDLQGENQILWEMLWQAIRCELTDDQRHVIILRFIEGFSLQETASILGKSVNLIKAAQNRAVANLRKCMYRWETA